MRTAAVQCTAAHPADQLPFACPCHTPPLPAPADDPDLTYWVKLPSPVMALPPAGINISCWRDPFCLQRPAAAGKNDHQHQATLHSTCMLVAVAALASAFAMHA